MLHSVSFGFVAFFAAVLARALAVMPTRGSRLFFCWSQTSYSTGWNAVVPARAGHPEPRGLCVRNQDGSRPSDQLVAAPLADLSAWRPTSVFSSTSNTSTSLGTRSPRCLACRLHTLDIVLPVGISFFTFKTMSYTIDVYRGACQACRSAWRFAMFVSFFPELVAGPIVRASIFLPQMERPIRLSGRE